VSAASGRVAWIATAPVKGLRLALRDEAVFERSGIAGDRAYYLVDADGRLTNAKRAGGLLRATAETENGRLRVTLPDGAVVDGEVELDGVLETDFYGRPVKGRVVRGPWAEALSALAGLPLTLVRADESGAGLDRGAGAAASLVSTAALDALAHAAGVDGPVDGRRFRMNLGVDGIAAHEEDAWLGRRVAVGEAVLVPRGNVGRCRVTCLGPETGVRDLQTLDVIDEYRAGVETTEPLPFGVWCEVAEPGRVAVGDPAGPP
jgi:MOSC domain-containing protein